MQLSLNFELRSFLLMYAITRTTTNIMLMREIETRLKVLSGVWPTSTGSVCKGYPSQSTLTSGISAAVVGDIAVAGSSVSIISVGNGNLVTISEVFSMSTGNSFKN